MKILVVEDQKRLGQFLKKGLSEHSYTVTWVQSCSAQGGGTEQEHTNDFEGGFHNFDGTEVGIQHG